MAAGAALAAVVLAAGAALAAAVLTPGLAGVVVVVSVGRCGQQRQAEEGGRGTGSTGAQRPPVALRALPSGGADAV